MLKRGYKNLDITSTVLLLESDSSEHTTDRFKAPMAQQDLSLIHI